MHIIWTIIIGFVAGVIAKFITPGDNEPSGPPCHGDPRHRRRLCGQLYRPRDRLVPGGRGRRTDRSRRRGRYRPGDLGTYHHQASLVNITTLRRNQPSPHRTGVGWGTFQLLSFRGAGVAREPRKPVNTVYQN